MQRRKSSTEHILKSYRYLAKISVIKALIETNTWKRFRFKITLFTRKRANGRCHSTRFLRMPTQFEALHGPVLHFLLREGNVKSLKVTVMGCSFGAEPYSIASILRTRRPDIEFTVYAYDIDQGCIDKARSARYAPEEVMNKELITASDSGKAAFNKFIKDTFDKMDGYYIIKSDIRSRVHFEVADALDPNLRERIGTSDIVFAQHFLFHLQREQARQGFKNMYTLLNPKSVLFISGVDPDIKVNLSRKLGLIPCDYKAEEIHKEVAMIQSNPWPNNYTGVEPFMNVRKDWKRRYSTIFFRS